jgi:S-(hydroxymethyl)glutathione dehydrogenase / alcohol dehydrogenase
MKAALLDKPGGPLTIVDDIDIIDPRPGEVRVRVKYCGLCHSDLSVINSNMHPEGEMKIVGHEAAGIVDCVGAGVSHLKPGDHVVLTPAPPCGQCYYCQRNQHSLCVNAMGIMTGTLADGETGLSRQGKKVMRGLGVAALAEYVITPANGAIKVDENVPLDVVCVIGCALQTGVGAVLNTAQMEAGATAIIMGAGGIGIAALQGAKIAGASTIVVSDPVEERRNTALEFGATHVIDPYNQDLATLCMELTDNIGMDYAFETAGVAKSIEDGISLIRPGGTVVCVGSPPVEDGISIDNVVLFNTLEKKLCGCLLGSSNSLHEIPRLIRLWQSGQLDIENMVTSRRPLEEVNLGLEDLANSRGIRTVIEI